MREKKVQTEFRLQTLPYLILTVIFSFATFFILNNANWMWGDDVEWLTTTAIGKIEPMSNHAGPAGRFWPLGHYDFNILTFIKGGNTPLAHYILITISFLILGASSTILYKHIIKDSQATDKYRNWIIVFCVSFLVLKVYPLFIAVAFPERIISVLLTIFILSYYCFLKTDKLIYSIITLFSAIYISYCKEPISIVIFIFALTNILFGYKTLTKNQKILHFLLCFNLIVFTVLYYFIVYRNESSFYYQQPVFNSMSYISIFIKVLRSHKILILIYLIFVLRVYSFFIMHDRKSLFYDSMLFSGILYSVILIFLKLHFSHYYFPIIVLCMPSLICYSLQLFKIPLDLFKSVRMRKLVCLNKRREEIVLIVLFISFVTILFYSIKYVKANQRTRIECYSGTAQFVDYISNGYELIWYRNPLQEKSPLSSIIDWKRDIISEFIDYNLPKPYKFKFGTISSLNADNKNTVILYSTFNNADTRIKESFDSLIYFNRFALLKSFGDINVYGYKEK